jgi:hypothetical protein
MRIGMMRFKASLQFRYPEESYELSVVVFLDEGAKPAQIVLRYNEKVC